MFKPVRWRSEKNKAKVVFKLQFHVTQVSKLLGDTLMVTLVPLDTGKPTVRLEKALVKDGSCYWVSPVYETIKFTQDLKTGRFCERIYQLRVSTGLSKAGVVGEVAIDFAVYADAIKPSSVSYPLKNLNSDAILHVTIQKMQEFADLREVEDNEEAKIRSPHKSLRAQLSFEDIYERSNHNSTDDRSFNKTKPQNVEPNGTLRSSSGSDLTISSSEISSGLNTPRELGAKDNLIHQEPSSFLLSPRKSPKHLRTLSSLGTFHAHQKSQEGWPMHSVHDIATEDSMNNSQNGLPVGRSHPASDVEIEKLKSDLLALSRQAEVSELEIQTLRKQIVKERKRGEELSREVAILKQNRDACRTECEKLKAIQNHSTEAKITNMAQHEGGAPRALLEELQQELNYEKDLNANLHLRLQKTQDSNAELILAVQDLDEMLEQKSKEWSDRCNNSAIGENAGDTRSFRKGITDCKSDEDEEQKALEVLVKEHGDTQDAQLLEQQITDLRSELEIYQRDKDELEMQMEQLALDYEILKQENHDISYKLEQSQLQEQLRMQYECSGSYATISELETHIEGLESELQKQTKEYSGSLSTIRDLGAHVKNLEEELKKRDNRDMRYKLEQSHLQEKLRMQSGSFATISELETQIEGLEKELQKQAKEFSDSLSTINELEAHVKSLEEELKKHENREMSYKLEQSQLQEQLRMHSASFATIGDLESQIEGLEKELKKKSDEFSDSLSTIGDLEAHVKKLEEELEKRAQSFEADLESITHAKVEQEQRAIKVEELLRITRWRNVNTAVRLQEEFNRLSTQMSSTFDTNEKLATKALTEANELRLQKTHLEDLFQKANEELQLARDCYESKIQDLSNQIYLKTTQMEQMMLEYKDNSKELDNLRKHEKEVYEELSQQILFLRTETERLKAENDKLSEQAELGVSLRAEMERLKEDNFELSERAHQGENWRAELENVKASKEEAEMLVKSMQSEKSQLEHVLISTKAEVERSMEEVIILRNLKEEKEMAVVVLQSELATLKAQHKDLKNSLFEDETEKEKLRKQVFQLKGDLKQKEEAITSLEKKLKDCNGRAVVSNGAKATPRSNKSGASPGGPKEVATLRDKIKLLEGQIKQKEVALETSTNAFLEKEKDLHDKVEELEIRVEELNHSDSLEQLKLEIKTKEAALEASTHAFLDKEKELLDKVEELEKRVDELNCSGSSLELKLQKVPQDSAAINFDDITPEEIEVAAGDLSTMTSVPKENGFHMSVDARNDLISEEQADTSTISAGNQKKLDKLLDEMALLKEKNKLMECELKEMGERYSEISLKFAEVEGERQKLVMTVRNLKNATKN